MTKNQIPIPAKLRSISAAIFDNMPQHVAATRDAKITFIARMIDHHTNGQDVRIAKLEEALLTALPYVEDAINSPDFKPGIVRKHAAMIRALIETD